MSMNNFRYKTIEGNNNFHASDCAVHSEPAFTKGECNCEKTTEENWLREQLRKASQEVDSWPQWMKNAFAEERASRKKIRSELTHEQEVSEVYSTLSWDVVDRVKKNLESRKDSLRPYIREEVSWFADEMETRLQANDWKGGWKNCDLPLLFARMIEEAGELSAAMHGIEEGDILKEAADVANFAMMIADVARDCCAKYREEMKRNQ
jgi:NTP pyrophosphatase (non-canonical NTP hydrolase)